MPVRSNQHLKKQGRCELFKREPPEGEEDTFEPTEEEQVGYSCQCNAQTPPLPAHTHRVTGLTRV